MVTCAAFKHTVFKHKSLSRPFSTDVNIIRLDEVLSAGGSRSDSRVASLSIDRHVALESLNSSTFRGKRKTGEHRERERNETRRRKRRRAKEEMRGAEVHCNKRGVARGRARCVVEMETRETRNRPRPGKTGRAFNGAIQRARGGAAAVARGGRNVLF